MFTIDQIETAHRKVKTGADFPQYIKEIKRIGVVTFETWVNDSHTDYSGENGFKISSKPMYRNLEIANNSDPIKFKHYLSVHQQGQSDYLTFCKNCAETGIEKWFVSLVTMTCTYYDKAANEILVERIPEQL